MSEESGIQLNISPTLVNVFTDVILIVLGLFWVRMMIYLTRFNMKSDLRKEKKIFSFERLGTFTYFTSGRTKTNYMRNKGILEPPVQRQFQLKTILALFVFTCTLTLISLHALIDYGLDFTSKPTLTSGTYEYEGLTALESNPNITNSLESFRDLSEERDFCTRFSELGNNCRDVHTWAIDHLQQHLREGVGFAKTLYETPSLTQVDTIDEIEIGYLAVAGERQCEILEKRDADEFEGNLEFDGQGDCELRETSVRRLSLDMRAKRRRNSNVDIPSRNLLAFYTETGVDTQVKYVSYSNFKADPELDALDDAVKPLQPPTVIDVKKLEQDIGENPEGYKFANISVNAKLLYEPFEQQRIILTDLSLRQYGFSFDDDFTLPLLDTNGTNVLTTDCLQVEDGRFNLNTTLFFRGEKCGDIEVVAATGRCDRVTAEVLMNGNWEEARVGIQRMDAMVLMPKDHGCRAKAMEVYGDQIGTDMTELVVFLRYSMICTFVEPVLQCGYGRSALQWEENQWVEAADDQSDSGSLRVIRSKTEIGWHSIEVSGGDPNDAEMTAELEEVFTNIEGIFTNYYPELKLHSDQGVSRGRILGFKVHQGMRGTLAALSTQIGATSRTMANNKEETIAVLRNAYLGGSLAVIGICFVAALVTLIRWIMDIIASRKTGENIRVPTTITEWIEAALRTSSDLEKEVAEKPQFFEYTARKVDDDSLGGGERRQSTGTHIGFWETPEALETTATDIPSAGSPEPQPSSRRWMLFQ